MTRMATLTAAAAAAGAALLCACNPPTDEDAAQGASIAGTSWTVAALEGRAPVVGDRGGPTIAFAADGRVSGATGCNNFMGGYVLGPDGALTLGGDGAGLATTQMACEPELDEQEARMHRVLAVVRSYAVGADGRLALKNAAGETVLEATPVG